MTTYYVRKSGNDTTGNGSTGMPWLTIAKAVATISNAGGHTVNIGTGTYAEDNGSGLFNISRNFTAACTFQTETGLQDVIITGASSAASNVTLGQFGNPCNNINFLNLTFGCWTTTNTFAAKLVHASYLNFTTCLFIASGTAICFLFQQTSDTGNSDSISFTSCAASQTGSSAATGWQVQGRSDDFTRLTNVTLTNCSANMVGQALLIQNCLTGISVVGGSYISSGSYGMQIGADGGFRTAAIDVTCSISGAYVSNTGGNGHALIVGGHADSVTITNCHIFGSYLYGIILKECTNCTVQYNVIMATGTSGIAVYYRGSTGNSVKNNIIIKSASGAQAIYENSGNTGNKCQNNIFQHNTVVCAGGAPLFGGWDSSTDNGGSVVDNNRYYATSWGSIRGTSISSLETLQAAWVGYSNPLNDANSGAEVYLPQGVSRGRGQ